MDTAPEAALYAARWDDALTELEARERAAARRGDTRARITALVATSLVLLDEGLNRRADVARAFASAEHARVFAEQLGDRALIADALDRIGNVRYWEWVLADPTSGDALLLEAAAQFQRARSLRDGDVALAYSHFHLGLIAEAQEQAAAAREHFARALELAGGDRKMASYALRHLASHDEAAGRLEIAEQRLRQSLELRRALGWKTGVASALDGLAGFLRRQQRGAEAHPLLREALAIARDAGSRYYVTRVARTLALVHEQAGDIAAAISVLREVRDDAAALEAASLRDEHAALLERLEQQCPHCASRAPS